MPQQYNDKMTAFGEIFVFVISMKAAWLKKLIFLLGCEEPETVSFFKSGGDFSNFSAITGTLFLSKFASNVSSESRKKCRLIALKIWAKPI